MLSFDKRLSLDTWNLFGSQENDFVSPRSRFESSRTPYQGIRHTTTTQVLQVRFQCMFEQGQLLQEVKNDLGAQSQCRLLQEGRRP